ncbi:AbgT family transporter [Flavonifractor sp. An100]|uniref:AbgT family transporter n=1 Tax=Flavonifractor sp. An100 TaxID=1965538 RepID=UPI000B3AA879|nr:AbgT family transporter [Flavonifractor sp. An100]OUQ78318.1 aminobenzoyl-glutamate transporter [Flavonifractor sp. An100]
MSNRSGEKKISLYNRWLNGIEAVGNKLPHPIALFALLALLIVIISAVCAAMGVSATGELISGDELKETTVTAVSLLTKDGLAYIFSKAVSNFTSYAPLGMVLVAMLGVGVAEQSGLINALLKQTVKVTPKAFITPVVVFLGVMSNIASDAGYVVLIPLGAMVFRAYGRHPMAGLAAAFCGVSGGFSANLLVGTLDPLLAGISQTAASIIDPNYHVAVMGNYYFMCASTFLITILGTIITDKLVEPRLEAFGGELLADEDTSLTTITPEEKKGLKRAGIVALIFVLVIVAACIPQNSFFRNANGSLLGRPASPLIDGVVVLIALLFFFPAVAFGKTVGTLKDHREVCNAMSKSMAAMGSFLALAFVSSQFIQYFNYTKLGTIIALNGANFLREAKVGLIPLMVIFVLFSAFMNLFMGSASAKWNILAPVFVPMFMLLGYSPELCQLAYRIGDSSTNIITPMMTYFAVIVVFAQRYDKKAGIGTITATMLPYSICFLFFWTIMLVIWLSLGLPIGVDTGLFYPAV